MSMNACRWQSNDVGLLRFFISYGSKFVSEREVVHVKRNIVSEPRPAGGRSYINLLFALFGPLRITIIYWVALQCWWLCLTRWDGPCSR